MNYKSDNTVFSSIKLIRINHYLSSSGLFSRRLSEYYIKSGNIKVNGDIITDLSYKVSLNDCVKFNKKIIKPIYNKKYLLFNKPKGIIITKKDEKNRKTFINFLPRKLLKFGIHYIGRLDKDTTGVLLLTNDGYLTNKLTHPKYLVKKKYHVILNKDINIRDINLIYKGLVFKEGIVFVDKIFYINKFIKNKICIVLHIGWNKIIRRIFSKLGYKVISIDRISFAGIYKNNVNVGCFRFLSREEVFLLKNI